MTPHAITVHEYTDIAEAAELMITSGIKSVPVVDDDRHLVGVLSRSDLVRVRARARRRHRARGRRRLVSMGHQDWLVEVNDGHVEIDGPDSRDRPVHRPRDRQQIPGVVAVRVR